ncbi:hypothetical protein GCM10028777_39240 [Angustibacter speluncae]
MGGADVGGALLVAGALLAAGVVLVDGPGDDVDGGALVLVAVASGAGGCAVPPPVGDEQPAASAPSRTRAASRVGVRGLTPS